MTRINLVDPSELTNRHLIAEHKEILQLCGQLVKTLNSKKGFVKEKVPPKFTLGTGHVYFFYDKGEYLHNRFFDIKQEMSRRGFNSDSIFPEWDWPAHLYNDWRPREEDKNIVRARIAQRIAEKPHLYANG